MKFKFYCNLNDWNFIFCCNLNVWNFIFWYNLNIWNHFLLKSEYSKLYILLYWCVNGAELTTLILISATLYIYPKFGYYLENLTWNVDIFIAWCCWKLMIPFYVLYGRNHSHLAVICRIVHMIHGYLNTLP